MSPIKEVAYKKRRTINDTWKAFNASLRQRSINNKIKKKRLNDFKVVQLEKSVLQAYIKTFFEEKSFASVKTQPKFLLVV